MTQTQRRPGVTSAGYSIHFAGTRPTTMRIGLLLPTSFAVGTRGSGIAEQARQQARALEDLGHTVIRLNPWEWQDERQLDVLHLFLGGPSMVGAVEYRNLSKPGLLVFSPIIDSNQSFATYRLAAALGGVSNRILTVPGLLRRQALASDVVVCRSSHEMQRVVRGLGVSPGKTAIVLNGCPPTSGAAGDSAVVRQKWGLPQDFVLHISAFTQERKNVLRLVEATERLGYPLVIAGTLQPGPILTELERRAQASDRIRILGFIDERTKAALYSLCRVFCLPSTHEGTGLVALEAGAAGANLVVTRNGGPPDYFLDYAEYIDPGSTRSVQEGLSRAWCAPRNEKLQRHIIERLNWAESGRCLERLYSSRLGLKAGLPAREPAQTDTIAGDQRTSAV
jgi:glycosyltransferase involved in cell wall biosynthesis